MTRPRARWVLALVLATAGALGAPVVSAEPQAADVGTARRLFEEATALERQSAWQAASEKLERALAIKETPGLHFHRAHCAEQLGELVLAARHYARSEELIRAGAAAPDVEELLHAARARVLARVPRLTLAFPNDVVGASLEIDGTRVADPPGTPVLLDPGRHRIVARAPGRRDFETEITLVEGQTQTLEVLLAAPKAAVPAPSAARPKRPPSDSPALGTREIVLLGEATVAVVGLGAGVGFSIARSSAHARIVDAQRRVDADSADERSGCSEERPPPACGELDAAMIDYERATRFATIGFVAAGAGAAAAALTWVLWPAERAPVTVAVERRRGGAWLALGGAF